MIGQPVTCRVFVGRADELAALHGVRRGLAKSQGAAFLVGGEAGIGKSRLLSQFVRQAGDGRARNLATAECLERAQQPFGPVRTFLSLLVGMTTEQELPAVVVRALRQLVPEDAPAGPPASETDTGLGKAELFAALLAFFKLVSAKRATILTIEDLHWADRSTLEFLRYLVPRLAGTRLMLIATYRTEEVEENEALFEALSRIRREPTVHNLVLESFSPSDVRAILAGALEGHAGLPRETALGIEDRCEGNPFFAEELLKSALEQRNSSGPATLPLSIRAGILQRLATLGDEERRVLAHAAVLGYRFDPAVLAVVMDRDVDAVLPALRRARDLNIVVEEDGDQVRCRFRHALTRQIIYDDMLAFDIRRLHRHILRALESLGDSERHLEELAYHAWEARDLERTLRYNERAGESALVLRALSDAASCFERARGAATDEADTARLHERIGCVAQLQGRLSAAVDAFERALTLRLRRCEFDDAARLATWIVGDRSNLGEDGAIAYAERFVAEHGPRMGVASRDRVLALAARLMSGHYDFAGVERVLSGASPPEQLAPLARQNYFIAKLNEHAFFGQTELWKRVATQLYGIVPLLPPYNAVIALYTLAQTGCHLGANQELERAFADCEEIERLWGFTGIAVFGSVVRASYLYQRGRLAQARTCIERALERPDITVARTLLVHVGPLVGVALDDDDLAARCLDERLVADARECAIALDSAIVFAARATWFSKRGRLAEARSDLLFALDALPRATPSAATLLFAAARNLALSDLSRVAQLSEAACGASDNIAGRANAAMVAAIVAERTGSQSEAIAAATEAAAAYRLLGWPIFEARALECACRPDEARALYAACGAVAEVRRLQPDGSPAARSRLEPLLSAREREVAQLVARGFTNASIAEGLSVSNKTVEKHLSSIFAKLAIRSRAQIAAFIAREGVGA